MDKNSFLIYLDYEEQFRLLTDEELGQLMRAIIYYEKTGDYPELCGVVGMAFSFIRAQLDRDRDKWSEEKQKRSDAGRLGGIARAKKQGQALSSKSKQCLDSLSTAKQTQANQADNVDVDVNVNVNDNSIINNNKSNMIIKANKETEKLQIKFIECINSYNPHAIEECISYLDDLPYEVIEQVLIKTSGINRPNWNYAKKILDDYVKKRIDTLEKVEINQSSSELKGEWTDE